MTKPLDPEELARLTAAADSREWQSARTMRCERRGLFPIDLDNGRASGANPAAIDMSVENAEQCAYLHNHAPAIVEALRAITGEGNCPYCGKRSLVTGCSGCTKTKVALKAVDARISELTQECARLRRLGIDTVLHTVDDRTRINDLRRNEKLYCDERCDCDPPLPERPLGRHRTSCPVRGKG